MEAQINAWKTRYILITIIVTVKERLNKRACNVYSQSDGENECLIDEVPIVWRRVQNTVLEGSQWRNSFNRKLQPLAGIARKFSRAFNPKRKFYLGGESQPQGKTSLRQKSHEMSLVTRKFSMFRVLLIRTKFNRGNKSQLRGKSVPQLMKVTAAGHSVGIARNF